MPEVYNEQPDVQDAPPENTVPPSQRSSVRKSLERTFDEIRKNTEDQERERQRTAKGKQARGRAPEPDDQTDGEPAPTEAPQTQDEGQGEGQTEANAPPVGWTKEAKAEWGSLPPTVQAAVTKREKDTAKGVEELKKKYEEIDKAFSSRLDMLRRYNKTPAQAVEQLFSWHEALAGNPDVAFPALAKAFGYDLGRLAQSQPQSQQGTEQQTKADGKPASQEELEVHPLVKQLVESQVGSVNQKLAALEQYFRQLDQQKTEDILHGWSKDKPYYQEVRGLMGHLIGSGAVAPLENGSADLDTAYERAVWAVPEVREKMLAERQQQSAQARKAKQEAERKAQQEQAEKARRAGGSLGIGAPGGEAQQAKQRGKSVRESLLASIDELRQG